MLSLVDIILHVPCAMQGIAHLIHTNWLQLWASPSHPSKDPVTVGGSNKKAELKATKQSLHGLAPHLQRKDAFLSRGAMLCCQQPQRTGKALQPSRAAVQDLEGAWVVQGRCRGYRELQRVSSHKGDGAWESSCRTLSLFACSVATLKATLPAYLFFKRIKQSCRMVCRVQCPDRELVQKSLCSRTFCPQRSQLHVVDGGSSKEKTKEK